VLRCLFLDGRFEWKKYVEEQPPYFWFETSRILSKWDFLYELNRSLYVTSTFYKFNFRNTKGMFQLTTVHTNHAPCSFLPATDVNYFKSRNKSLDIGRITRVCLQFYLFIFANKNHTAWAHDNRANNQSIQLWQIDAYISSKEGYIIFAASTCWIQVLNKNSMYFLASLLNLLSIQQIMMYLILSDLNSFLDMRLK
jgi:hypothetical protein